MRDYGKAIEVAMRAHDGQYRKNSKVPYIIHPLRVASKILLMTSNMTLATAAILHDVLEDTDVSVHDLQETFGYSVAKLVQEVTDDMSIKQELGKIEYWAYSWANMSQTALTLKMYDRLDNICDSPTLEYVAATLEAVIRLDTSNFGSMVSTAHDLLKRECKAYIKGSEDGV